MSRLLTINEGSAFLKITNVYLYQLIKRGEIGAIRIGRRGLRVKEEELIRWIEERSDHRGEA